MGRKALLFLILALGGAAMHAQNLTRSPYSRLGVGDLQFFGFAQQRSLGQITQGYMRDDDYSPANPASFAGLHYTVYNFGIFGTTGTIKNSTQSQGLQTASIGYFSLGVPLLWNKKREWGASFGVLPYSGIGYNSFANKTGDTITGDYRNIFQGSGGLNRAYVGTGFKLFRGTYIGASASLLYGQLVSTTKLYFNSSTTQKDYRQDETRLVHGFNFDIGLQVSDTIKKFRNPADRAVTDALKLTFGVTYTMGNNLKAEQRFFGRTVYNYSDFDYTYDTVKYTDGFRGSIVIPQGIKAGIGIGNTRDDSKWFAAAEVQYQQWSQYKSFGVSEGLADYLGGSIGFSYRPAKPTARKDAGEKKQLFRFVQYSAGLRYAKSQLQIGSDRIPEYGANLGFGMPVRTIGGLFSSINLNFEYISRGTTANSLIKENYFRFTLGLRLMDNWFRKFKIE